MLGGYPALAFRSARRNSDGREKPRSGADSEGRGSAVHGGQAESQRFAIVLAGSVPCLLINEVAEKFALIIILRLTVTPVQAELMIWVGASVIDDDNQFICSGIVRYIFEVVGSGSRTGEQNQAG